MIDPSRLLERVAQQLETALVRHPPASDRPYSLTLPLPELRLGGLVQVPSPWFYWSRPAREEYRLGVGQAINFSCHGERRFQALENFFHQTAARWDRIDPQDTQLSPVLFTGFAFSAEEIIDSGWRPLPNAGLFLPELLLQQKGNRCTITCSLSAAASRQTATVSSRWLGLIEQLFRGMAQRPGPPGHKTMLTRIHDTPAREPWLAAVQQALRAIEANALEKVVLSRSIRVRAQRRLNPVQLMSTLDCLYPNNLHFAIAQAGLTFVAASPERLLRCEDRRIFSDALAGTAPRSADEAEDRQIGLALQHDPKAGHEHRLVVDSIRQSLGNVCQQVGPVMEPRLLRLRGLQHLRTEVSGLLKPGASLFSAAAQLHPSAAVNGTLRQPAQAWLQAHEDQPRGWYTGAAGWIDPAGNGDLAVLIRCALLEGDEAELFAGAGITRGSDPATEYRETELKFTAMLEALENA